MDHSLSRDTQSLQRCSVSLITQAKNALLNIIHMPVTILFHYWSMVHFCHLQKNYTYSANYTKVVFEILIRTKCFREDGLFPCVAFWVGNLAALVSDCKQMPRSTMEKHDGLQIVWTSDMEIGDWRLYCCTICDWVRYNMSRASYLFCQNKSLHLRTAAAVYRAPHIKKQVCSLHRL